MVLRSQNRRVRDDCGFLDARYPVDAGFLIILMNVVDQGRNVRESRSVRDRPAVRIEATLPARVDIDVVEAMRLKPGGGQGIGLRGDIGLGQKTGVDGLLAEGAPAEIGSFADSIHLRGCIQRRDQQAGDGQEGQEQRLVRPRHVQAD